MTCPRILNPKMLLEIAKVASVDVEVTGTVQDDIVQTCIFYMNQLIYKYTTSRRANQTDMEAITDHEEIVERDLTFHIVMAGMQSLYDSLPNKQAE